MENQKSQLESIKSWFDRSGTSISEWALAKGFNRQHVYAVLNGRVAGRRGSAHRIAVELGLKQGQAPEDGCPADVARRASARSASADE